MKPTLATTDGHDDISNSVFAAVRSTTTPVMVFGSFARGDASAHSDLDVLELTSRSSRAYRAGRVHVYRYGRRRLTAMAEGGSLFVLHLRLEGKTLRDPGGLLHSTLDSYRTPTTYEPYKAVLRATANLMDASHDAYVRQWNEYNDLAIFVLRTALYVQFAEAGRPLFSLTEIAMQLKSPAIDEALTLKNAPDADYDAFLHAVALVSDLLKTDIRNRFGTIEALITNEGLANPPLLSFGLRLLGNPSPAIGYDLLTFSPLG